MKSEIYKNFFEILRVYVTFDGDYEYLQKVWKKIIFDHFFDFFNLVSGLEKSRIIEKNKYYQVLLTTH